MSHTMDLFFSLSPLKIKIMHSHLQTFFSQLDSRCNALHSSLWKYGVPTRSTEDPADHLVASSREVAAMANFARRTAIKCHFKTQRVTDRNCKQSYSHGIQRGSCAGGSQRQSERVMARAEWTATQSRSHPAIGWSSASQLVRFECRNFGLPEKLWTILSMNKEEKSCWLWAAHQK